jgi:hypothetical protein
MRKFIIKRHERLLAGYDWSENSAALKKAGL